MDNADLLFAAAIGRDHAGNLLAAIISDVRYIVNQAGAMGRGGTLTLGRATGYNNYQKVENYGGINST